MNDAQQMADAANQALAHQIRQAQDNVYRSAQMVSEVRTRLAERIRQARERLAAITSQREQLLTR
ncbi:MAG TPA: hypothetical protein VGH96_15045 [Streptosporangiaceae bacterium]